MKAGRALRLAAGVISAAALIQGCTGAAPAASRGPGFGSSFAAEDASGDTYRVTLVKVIDPARPTATLDTPPDQGYRYLAVVFTVRALTGVPKDENAAADAVILGTDGLHYSSPREPVAGYADFGYGLIHVASGAAVTGAVLFEVAQGVNIASIEWTGGALKGTVRWHLAS